MGPRSEDQDCFYGKYESGRYIVAKSSEDPEQLISWISQTYFKAFEKEPYRLKKPYGRPRNKIYFFRIAPDHDMWAMKVSSIAPQYKLSRKIDLFLTSLHKDYAEDAFWGAKALYDCGVPVAEPLAFWTFRKNLFNKQSYFLCRKLAGQQTAAQWLDKHQAEILSGDNNASSVAKQFDVLVEKIMDIVRKIHCCKLRHGDIHLGNFNVDISDTEKQLPEVRLYLLDYDDCSRTRVRISWIKRFFDLGDLYNLHIPGLSDRQLLAFYFRSPPASCWLRVLGFWRNGGFSFRKRLGVDGKQEGRHLKS